MPMNQISMYYLKVKNIKIMENYPDYLQKILLVELELRLLIIKKIQRTLCYGSHLKIVSLFGRVHGAKEDLGGIWSVPPCPMKYWDQTLIFMEAA